MGRVLLVMTFVGVMPGLAVAQIWPPTCEITPPNPSESDRITITLSGEWGDTCVPNQSSVRVADSTINFDGVLAYPPDIPCATAMTPWSLSATVGPLPLGVYTVVFTPYQHGLPIDAPEPVCNVFVQLQPTGLPTLVWGDDVRLTQDGLSDTAPSAVVHNGQLHVLWNQSYDGTVRRGVLTQSSLQDLGFVANCPTGSGPGTASFRDSLYVFYAQGSYPVYHLFGQDLSEGSPPFALTEGDVYDRYGAACAVYNDTLHVFWKRWDGGPRYILHKTFDGIRWSDPTTVADDHYYDARPAVAVYDGRLFLFFHGGGHYKTFDGATWSAETVLSEHTYGNVTPAACTYKNRLHLFFRVSADIYCWQFDGAVWGWASRIPASPPDEVRDLAATVHNGKIHLLWGSYYSWSRSELYVKAARSYHGDFDQDGDVDKDDLRAFDDCANPCIICNVNCDEAGINVIDLQYVKNSVFCMDETDTDCLISDVNRDDSVNVVDLQYVKNNVFCTDMTVSVAQDCEWADFDQNGAVDHNDYNTIQGCLSGPNIPADPSCADTPAYPTEDCTNGLDDDDDGFVDCNDLDCAGDPACPTEDCTNGIDDDNDGWVDCDDFDCTDDPNCAGLSPRIDTYSNSGCLPGDAQKDGYPWCGDDTFEMTAEAQSLYVAHRNVTYNCCPDDIRVELMVAGRTLHLTEEEILTMPCHCLCCYDVETTIIGLSSGTYTVEYCWADNEVGPQCHTEEVSVP